MQKQTGKTYPLETLTKWKKQDNEVSDQKKLLSSKLKQGLKEKLLEEIVLMENPTPAEILSLSTIWQVKLTLKDWHHCLKTAGWYIPKVSSFSLAYIQDLVNDDKELFLPLFDPLQTYLQYIPSFLEEVDREYLIHVTNTIYTLGDDEVPLMVHIVNLHQRRIRELISNKTPKSNLIPGYSALLFREILHQLVQEHNPAALENQNVQQQVNRPSERPNRDINEEMDIQVPRQRQGFARFI